jgi:hypothetical protein
MPASRVTTRQVERAAWLHRRGYSQHQIARDLGLSRTAARTALRYAGIQPRSRVEGYRSWLAVRGGKGPHDGGRGAFGRRQLEKE